jgi:PAS domain S-box-containing protein
MGGFTVTTVRSGFNALDMILSGSFDIVVSDYHMPGMSGMDLLRAYREKGQNIPFILFTGKGREEVVIEAINEGATFYLQKGGDPASLFAELAHKIRQAVQAQSAQKALMENEEKYRRLFETAFDGIILLTNVTIVDCNNQAASLFHTDKHRMIGSDFTGLAPEMQPEGTRTKDKLRALLGTTEQMDGAFVTWKFRRFDGSFFDAEMSVSRLEIGGKGHFQAIIRDITDRIQAENELEQRNIDLSAA